LPCSAQLPELKCITAVPAIAAVKGSPTPPGGIADHCRAGPGDRGKIEQFFTVTTKPLPTFANR